MRTRRRPHISTCQMGMRAERNIATRCSLRKSKNKRGNHWNNPIRNVTVSVGFERIDLPGIHLANLGIGRKDDRSAANFLVIKSEAVSGRHASVQLGRSEWRILDNASSNGIYSTGKRRAEVVHTTATPGQIFLNSINGEHSIPLNVRVDAHGDLSINLSSDVPMVYILRRDPSAQPGPTEEIRIEVQAPECGTMGFSAIPKKTPRVTVIRSGPTPKVPLRQRLFSLLVSLGRKKLS